MFSSVKYNKLGSDVDTGDPTLNVRSARSSAMNFDSAFDYDEGVNSAKFRSDANYNSAFKWSGQPPHVSLQISGSDRPISKPSVGMVLASWILTFLSYMLFIFTSPITYFIFVKKLGEFDRLVVFRLGNMIGVKGPGRVLVFPWMDRTKKIDVRAAAFAVPPQQFITCDGGIVEMGAEVQYGIVDVITMVREVADHQDILRSLGKTLLVKLLVKKTIHQLERDKRSPAQSVQDELNDQVRNWGIDVHKVELSELKILKQPESSSNAAVGSILKGLGMKSESSYPTPEEFVRASHGLDETSGVLGHVSIASCIPPKEVPQGASLNMSLLQMMTNGQSLSGGGTQLAPGIVCGSSVMGDNKVASNAAICNWGRCLEVILQSEFVGNPEQEALGLYEIEITGTEAGTEKYFIEITATSKLVKRDCIAKPDVSVTISSSDLAGVLEGSLAPLQAYLTGRISANGDVKKLMLFDKLSRRGHKPGTMFDV